jgi:hypothetical protein
MPFGCYDYTPNGFNCTNESHKQMALFIVAWIGTFHWRTITILKLCNQSMLQTLGIYFHEKKMLFCGESQFDSELS